MNDGVGIDAEAGSKDLEEREFNLTIRGAEVEALATFQAQRATELDARDQVLLEKERELAERERGLKDREVEADAGFAQKNRGALSRLEEAHRQTRSQLDELENRLAEERARREAELQRWLDEERSRKTLALEKELTETRARAEQERAQAWKQHEATVQASLLRNQNDAATHDARAKAELQRIRTEASALESKDRAVAKKEAELAGRERAAAILEQETRAFRAEAVRQAAEKASEALADREARIQEQSRQLNELLGRSRLLETELEEYRRADEQGGESLKELKSKVKEHKDLCAKLEDELRKRPRAEDKARLSELEKQQTLWAKREEDLGRELTGLKAERARWRTSVAELEQEHYLRDLAERKSMLLATELERITNIYSKPSVRANRVASIEVPWLAEPGLTANPKRTEVEWLEQIMRQMEASGFKFPARLVRAFHTSLKISEWSPLTVLGGVSGTGKSELPRLYARFGGLSFISLPVQPAWDGPASLFGFFNSVDNRFDATPLLRALQQSQRAPDASYPGTNDRLLLALLDEMNLAHVEQYFSDMLSKLEQRRGLSGDVYLDLSLGAGEEPYPLKLGRNVLWTGTMNEDETTKALSEKVIDRSNIIHFPRPKTLKPRRVATLAEEAKPLPLSIWTSWGPTASSGALELDKFRETLESINEHLEKVGRALGHRVWQSIEAYIANHPQVMAARQAQSSELLSAAVLEAFEDQVVLKVMPKLRGIDTSGQARLACLDPIRTLLKNVGLNLDRDFELACRVGFGAFVWSSAHYLDESEGQK